MELFLDILGTILVVIIFFPFTYISTIANKTKMPTWLIIFTRICCIAYPLCFIHLIWAH